MAKIFFPLIPLVGTAIGSALGTFSNFYRRFSDEENSLVAIATGILLSIYVNLVLEAFAFFSDAQTLKFLAIGVCLGILFMQVMNRISLKTKVTRYKLFWAMLIHNIPEGLLIGVALVYSTVISPIPLVLSITLQNLPDGFVVSMPFVKTDGKFKSFVLGVLSGVVEPLIAVLMIFLSDSILSLCTFEPLLIGFSMSTILLITIDLFRECSSKKVVFISAVIGMIFVCF